MVRRLRLDGKRRLPAFGTDEIGRSMQLRKASGVIFAVTKTEIGNVP